MSPARASEEPVAPSRAIGGERRPVEPIRNQPTERPRAVPGLGSPLPDDLPLDTPACEPPAPLLVPVGAWLPTKVRAPC